MPQAESDSEATAKEHHAPGMAPGTQESLRQHAIQPGQVLNKTGTNAWRKAQARIAKFMRGEDPARPGTYRIDNTLQAAYETSLIRGPQGAPDRKLLTEQVAGKAKQQHEVTGDGGSALRVLAVLPDNGRGPEDLDGSDDEDPDDGEPVPSAP